MFTAQCVQYSTVQYTTVQYSTVQYAPGLIWGKLTQLKK